MENNKNIDLTMKNIIYRLKSPSPSFFKKITWIMVSLGGLGTSFLGLTALGAPVIYHNLGIHFLLISTIGAFLSKLTVDWDKVNETTKQTPEINVSEEEKIS